MENPAAQEFLIYLFIGSLETLYEKKKLSLFVWIAPRGDADRIVLEAMQASQPEGKKKMKREDSTRPWTQGTWPSHGKQSGRKANSSEAKHHFSEWIFCWRNPALTADRWAVPYRNFQKLKWQVFLLVSLLFGYISSKLYLM